MLIEKFHFVRILCKLYKYLTESHFKKSFRKLLRMARETVIMLLVDAISRVCFPEEWQNKKFVTGKMLLMFDFRHTPQGLSSPHHDSQRSPVYCNKIAEVKDLGLPKTCKCPWLLIILTEYFHGFRKMVWFAYEDSAKHGL